MYKNFKFQVVKDRSVPQRVYIVATDDTKDKVICGDWKLGKEEAIQDVKTKIDNFLAQPTPNKKPAWIP